MKSRMGTLLVIVCVAGADPAVADEFAPMALNSFSIVPHAISRAIVVNQDGTAIGIVQRVEIDSTGKPVRVEILMPGGREAPVPAQAASYDSITNHVIAENDVRMADAR